MTPAGFAYVHCIWRVNRSTPLRLTSHAKLHRSSARRHQRLCFPLPHAVALVPHHEILILILELFLLSPNGLERRSHWSASSVSGRSIRSFHFLFLTKYKKKILRNGRKRKRRGSVEQLVRHIKCTRRRCVCVCVNLFMS